MSSKSIGGMSRAAQFGCGCSFHQRYAFRRKSSRKGGSFLRSEDLPYNRLVRALGKRLLLDFGHETVFVLAILVLQLFRHSGPFCPASRRQSISRNQIKSKKTYLTKCVDSSGRSGYCLQACRHCIKIVQICDGAFCDGGDGHCHGLGRAFACHDGECRDIGIARSHVRMLVCISNGSHCLAAIQREGVVSP
jgi:hypothetical protein